jgi:hypothetical protein
MRGVACRLVLSVGNQDWVYSMEEALREKHTSSHGFESRPDYLKKNNMNSNLECVVKDVSSKTFYKMERYSQLVIDLIEDIEDSDLGNPDTRGSWGYSIDNILDIIDPKRIYDIEILSELKVSLEKQ